MLVRPLALNILSSYFVKNLDLHFRNVKLLLDKVSADNNFEDFMLAFKYAEAKNWRKFSQLRIYNIAEFGIGVIQRLHE
ncbi:MAG: hypothetical protein ACFFAN_13225 [Promethearchaeota archaeon]